MRNLNKLPYRCEDVFNQCISKVRGKVHKATLGAAGSLVDQASADFEKKVTKGTLYTIPRKFPMGSILTVEDMERVYTRRMAGKKGPGRPIYDEIMLLAVLEICPMCGHRPVSELDHYLPKSQYPLLSTSPANLVPCCKDCNKLKDDAYPLVDFEEFLHPYYDTIDNDRWLQADVIQSTPCSFRFYAAPPPHWPELLKKRLVYHFETLKLGKLYASQAARELALRKHTLEQLLKIGPGAVSQELHKDAVSCSAFNQNAWQAAFYDAASRDGWFCGGGFL